MYLPAMLLARQVMIFSDVSIICVSVCVYYKKLRYREEHSASVVVSWCTL